MKRKRENDGKMQNSEYQSSDKERNFKRIKTQHDRTNNRTDPALCSSVPPVLFSPSFIPTQIVEPHLSQNEKYVNQQPFFIVKDIPDASNTMQREENNNYVDFKQIKDNIQVDLKVINEERFKKTTKKIFLFQFQDQEKPIFQSHEDEINNLLANQSIIQIDNYQKLSSKKKVTRNKGKRGHNMKHSIVKINKNSKLL